MKQFLKTKYSITTTTTATTATNTTSPSSSLLDICRKEKIRNYFNNSLNKCCRSEIGFQDQNKLNDLANNEKLRCDYYHHKGDTIEQRKEDFLKASSSSLNSAHNSEQLEALSTVISDIVSNRVISLFEEFKTDFREQQNNINNGILSKLHEHYYLQTNELLREQQSMLGTAVSTIQAYFEENMNEYQSSLSSLRSDLLLLLCRLDDSMKDTARSILDNLHMSKFKEMGERDVSVHQDNSQNQESSVVNHTNKGYLTSLPFDPQRSMLLDKDFDIKNPNCEPLYVMTQNSISQWCWKSVISDHEDHEVIPIDMLSLVSRRVRNYHQNFSFRIDKFPVLLHCVKCSRKEGSFYQIFESFLGLFREVHRGYFICCVCGKGVSSGQSLKENDTFLSLKNFLSPIDISEPGYVFIVPHQWFVHLCQIILTILSFILFLSLLHFRISNHRTQSILQKLENRLELVMKILKDGRRAKRLKKAVSISPDMEAAVDVTITLEDVKNVEQLLDLAGDSQVEDTGLSRSFNKGQCRWACPDCCKNYQTKGDAKCRINIHYEGGED